MLLIDSVSTYFNMIPYGENVLSIFSDTTESIKSMNISAYVSNSVQVHKRRISS
jgi:hypothetical protein